MKNIKILLGFLLCFFSKEGISQQHLTKTWSVSTGIVFNAKGGNTTVHYHLNSFDELRLNYYSIRQTYAPPGNITANRATYISERVPLLSVQTMPVISI